MLHFSCLISNNISRHNQAFAKFAMILSVVYDMLGETALAAAGLQKLESAFAKFVNNTQDYPLVYDSKHLFSLGVHYGPY